MSGMRLNTISINMAGNTVDRKIAEVKFDMNKIHKSIGNCGKEALWKYLNPTIRNCLESMKLMKIVLLEK
jgi:hypothetical protein